jgi:hypothetical protein
MGGRALCRRPKGFAIEHAAQKFVASFVGAAALATVAIGYASATDPAPDATREAPFALTASEHRVAEDFEARVKEYRALQRKLEASLPKLPKRATSEQVDQYQRALSAAVTTARAGAVRGEFFTADLEALVKRILAKVVSGRDGKNIRASIMDENPGLPNLAVNDRYPDSIPLSTMPAEILKALPKLEEDLEYRFIGERLVLMDPQAHIVLDFTGDVLPQ